MIFVTNFTNNRFSKKLLQVEFKVFLLLMLLSLKLHATSNLNVGAVVAHFKDEQRMAWDGKHQRPVTTHIFYPTTDTQLEPVMLGTIGNELFDAGDLVWNASIANEKKLPLIIMSHGTGGSALLMLWFAEYLGKSGFIVAGINHHGNTVIEKKKYAEGFKLWWERAQDLSVALDKITQDNDWSSVIDEKKIGVVGFSLGGHTAISAVGGITDKSLFNKFCQSNMRDFTCNSQLEFADIDKEFNQVKDTEVVRKSLSRQHDSFRIEPIKAAFVIAPAVVQTFTQASLKQITTPISIVVGSSDKVAPAKTNANRIYSFVANSIYNEFENVGHYTFLANCTELGRQKLNSLCIDHHNIVRQTIHYTVGQKAAKFFRKNL